MSTPEGQGEVVQQIAAVLQHVNTCLAALEQHPSLGGSRSGSPFPAGTNSGHNTWHNSRRFNSFSFTAHAFAEPPPRSSIHHTSLHTGRRSSSGSSGNPQWSGCNDLCQYNPYRRSYRTQQRTDLCFRCNRRQAYVLWYLPAIHRYSPVQERRSRLCLSFGAQSQNLQRPPRRI